MATLRRDGRDPAEMLSEGTVGSVLNDLQPLVLSRHPELSICLDRLRRAGAFAASLSGSGSSIFGLFREEPDAEAAASGGEWGDVRTTTCRFVSKSQYWARMGVSPPEDAPGIP